MKNRRINLLSTLERDNSSYVIWVIVIIFFITYVRGIVFYSGEIDANVQLLYIPILLSVFVFGIKGGIITSIFAGIAVGPYTPLNTATNTMQSTQSWLFRILMFFMIAIIFGLVVKQNEKLKYLLINKFYLSKQTNYYNSNKFNLKQMFYGNKINNISLIMFEYENLDAISIYDNLENGKISYLTLLDMANEFFNMGNIYIANKNKFIVILPEYNKQEMFILANEFIHRNKTTFNIDDFSISIVVKGGINYCLINEININEKLQAVI